MEKKEQGLADRRKINLMALIVSMPVGGVETHLLSFSQKIDKDKFNIMICCIKDLGALGVKALESGINIKALNLMGSNRFSMNIPYQISKVIRDNNIDILWPHQYVANLYGRLASLFVNIPAIVPTFHVLYDNPKLHRRIFNRILALRTDTMVCVSNAVAHDVVRFDNADPSKIKVIHIGINENKFDVSMTKKDARDEFNLPKDAVIAGSVGRLTEQKGYCYLLEAASRAGDICIAIAGDGPLMEELRTLAEKLRVRCFFLGKLDPDKVPSFIRSLDVFCFPSLWEGMPQALMEAMAGGLPVIASDIPPHREVLGDAGVFVPVKDTGSLCEALKKLASDNSLRESLARKTKTRVKLFSIEKTVKDYEGLFEKLMKQKRTRTHESTDSRA